jgi:GTP-binding protein HflX
LEELRQTLRVRKEKAILVAAILPGSGNDDLMELTALAESAGAVVIDRLKQKIHSPNPALYIGKGKAEELALRVARNKADVVIFDNDLLPRQIRELEEIIKVKIIDRSELILDIFATRAKTKQARLQVDLAQLEYTSPRLTGMWSHLDTVTGAAGGPAAGAVGGIGTRGTGEKQLEIDRRIAKKKIVDLRRQLEQIDKRRVREIDSRSGLFKICLVGYTNAGKSTLLNALTGADSLVEDRLFATLDTRTKRWILDRGLEVLLSDTVGFIKNLPHHLVASFKATLEEAVNADLLLHIIDVSNPEVSKQIGAVNKVLEELGCGQKQILEVFNKVDIVPDISRFEMLQTLYPQAVSVSAKTGLGLAQLTRSVIERCKGSQVVLRLKCSPANGKIISFLHAHGKIIEEKYDDGFVQIEVKLGQHQLPVLKKLNPEELTILS